MCACVQLTPVLKHWCLVRMTNALSAAGLFIQQDKIKCIGSVKYILLTSLFVSFQRVWMDLLYVQIVGVKGYTPVIGTYP